VENHGSCSGNSNDPDETEEMKSKARVDNLPLEGRIIQFRERYKNLAFHSFKFIGSQDKAIY
jgi:hypothetical protein